jgi:FtsZ-binding cell division protein ZapB
VTPMMEHENDSLRSLEERIHQAVQLVTRLRQEKEAAQQQAAQLAVEVEALRNERKQVRSRIEKLLGQVDQLSGA